MFTLLHPFAGFLMAAPFRKKLNLIAFFLGAMLPDLEGLYFIPVAYNSCAAFSGTEFAACAAEYPSHFLLHSFLGAVLVGLGIAVFFVFVGKTELLKRKINTRLIFISSVIGTLTHLFIDLFFHGGADAIPLLYPLDWRPSLAFLGLQQFWILIAYAGIVLFAYIYLPRKTKFFGMPKILQIFVHVKKESLFGDKK